MTLEAEVRALVAELKPLLEKATKPPWKVGIYTDNDGAISIMAPDEEMEVKRVAMVDSHVKVKRKDRWNTDCPERNANAALIVAAVNAISKLEKMVEESAMSVDTFTAGEVAQWLEVNHRDDEDEQWEACCNLPEKIRALAQAAAPAKVENGL